MLRSRVMSPLAAMLVAAACGDQELTAPGPRPLDLPMAAVLEPGTLVQLSGSCVLKTDGTVVCWGDAAGTLPPPQVRFREISVQRSYGCGITLTDSLVCWGQNDRGQASPPRGRFDHVSTGGAHGCALAPDGSITCWGANSHGQATAPPGTFTQIDAGLGFNCAIRSDAAIVCWGENSSGQTDPPSGQFMQVSAGDAHACALLTDRGSVCWGAIPPSYDYGHQWPTGGGFTQISASTYTCAITSTGFTSCWGLRPPRVEGHYFEPRPSPPSHGLTQVVTGSDYACGLTASGRVTCWGFPNPVMATPPSQVVTQVSAADRICFLRVDRAAHCLTVGFTDYTRPPPYHGDDYDPRYASSSVGSDLTQVSVGLTHNCAVKADSTLYCWGLDVGGYAPGRPPGRFTQVSAGPQYNCAVRSDHHLVCFGITAYGSWLEYEWLGLYRQVSSGPLGPCAIRIDDTLECTRQSGVPPGTFLQVSVANNATPASTGNGPNFCAIRTDGTLACWNSGPGVAPPPNGTFTRVSVGLNHACAVRSDGTLACWGNNRYGKATPPPGRFLDVAAGREFSCGVTADQGATCWGSYAIVETPVPVNRAPTAFPGGPYTADEGQSVALALSGTDPDGDPLIFTWDLGDGTSGTGPTPPATHTYPDNGTYTVRLTVSDGRGGEDTKTTTATIANVAPTIPAGGLTGPLNPVRIVDGSAMASIGLRFTDPAGTFDTYSAAIDCGNGTSLAPTAITSPYAADCRYTRAGIYTVRATVSDEDGGTSAMAHYQYALVYDPAGPFVTGGGWFDAPASACPTLCGSGGGAGKTHFTVEAQFAPDQPDAPRGAAKFWLQGKKALDVRSTSLTMLIAWDDRAQLWGPAMMNGASGYLLRISGLDGRGRGNAKGDAVRIELFDPSGVRVYDTQWGAPRDATPMTTVQGGQLKVHAP